MAIDTEALKRCTQAYENALAELRERADYVPIAERHALVDRVQQAGAEFREKVTTKAFLELLAELDRLREVRDGAVRLSNSLEENLRECETGMLDPGKWEEGDDPLEIVLKALSVDALKLRKALDTLAPYEQPESKENNTP